MLKFPLSKDCILRYLGKYNVGKIVIKAGIIIVSTGVLEATTCHMEHKQHIENTTLVHDMYIKDKVSTNVPLDTESKSYKETMKEVHSHLHKSAQGIVTKTLTHETMRHTYSTVGEVLRSLSFMVW